MEKYPKRIRFPEAEAAKEILDLPSRAQRQSYPHPPEQRFSGKEQQKDEDLKKREN